MITVEIEGSPSANLMDGDTLLVTPQGRWGNIRCNGPFVIITPRTAQAMGLRVHQDFSPDVGYEWYWLTPRRIRELELTPGSHWAEVRVPEGTLRICVSADVLADTSTHGFLVEEMQRMFEAEHERLRRSQRPQGATT